MVWQPGELGGKVRFCRLFATIVAFFWRSRKTQRIKIPFWALNMHRMPNFSTIFPAKDNGDIIAGNYSEGKYVGTMDQCGAAGFGRGGRQRRRASAGERDIGARRRDDGARYTGFRVYRRRRTLNGAFAPGLRGGGFSGMMCAARGPAGCAR
ncbi:hypothetical protein SM39_1354 [Serratia marcescens SM39]|uniref:Uncharacterized protein n=1 Tax=Serratia marcescens SM39 TaxID=1334564 RepID=A0AAT9E8Z6_SERMA|nr:hypothetical protein SM39_1354 [Serratia marcescens SM39]